MMRNTAFFLLAVLVPVVSCGDHEEIGPPAVNPSLQFRPQTSPENVVHNLQVAFRTRNIAAYEKLLAPEFIFKFQPDDDAGLGMDPRNESLEMIGTGGLLSSPLVSSISIELTHGPAEPVSEVGFPQDAILIRITQTRLEVEQTDGITWLVQGRQDMFFRPGRPQIGEDPMNWFLIEWRDIPSPAAASSALTPRTTNVSELLPGFPNGHHLIVENASHQYLELSNDEDVQIMVEFLEGVSPKPLVLIAPPPKFADLESASAADSTEGDAASAQ
jgi:hypothetical protein